MKVIVIRENITKGIVKTYVVNDDVNISDDCEDQIKECGYSITIFKPVPVGNNQESIEDDIIDYIGIDEIENTL